MLDRAANASASSPKRARVAAIVRATSTSATTSRPAGPAIEHMRRSISRRDDPHVAHSRPFRYWVNGLSEVIVSPVLSGPLASVLAGLAVGKRRVTSEMDFIERWFHVSPDGGSGLLEALYLGVAVFAVTALVFRARLIRAIRRRRD